MKVKISNKFKITLFLINFYEKIELAFLISIDHLIVSHQGTLTHFNIEKTLAEINSNKYD